MTGDTETSESPQRGQRGQRSPSYPIIDLKAALDMVEKLRQYSPGCKPMPVATAMSQLGYKPKSGGGLQRLSTLLKFGLLKDEGKKGQRVVNVTERARRILLDKTDSRERREAIRVAALEPTLHSDIRLHWPHGLPDDETVKRWLILDNNFNENAVDGVIEEIRATFEYAKLDQDLDQEDNEGGVNGDGEDNIKPGVLIQWLSQGQERWAEPKLVREVQEHNGEFYVFVDGENGAIPMNQAVITGPAAKDTAPSKTLPPLLQHPVGERRREIGEDIYMLGDSELAIRAPEYLTQEEYDDLVDYFELYKRKLKRRIKSDDGE